MQDWRPIKKPPPVGQSTETLEAASPMEPQPLPAPAVEPPPSGPAAEAPQLLGMPPHSQVLEFDKTLERDMEEALEKVTQKGANMSKGMDDSIFSDSLPPPDQATSASPMELFNKETGVRALCTFVCLMSIGVGFPPICNSKKRKTTS